MTDAEKDDFLLRMIDTMPGQIVVRDADSVIIFANRAFAAGYGKTPAQVQGMRDAGLWAEMGRPPEQIALWLAEDRAVLASGKGIEYVQEIVRANGEHAYFHNYKVVLTLAGGERYLLAQYADITQRRRQELELVQAEAITAELAAINKLAEAFSQEVNHPLASIIGLAHTMHDHEGNLDELRAMLEQQVLLARRVAEVTGRMHSYIAARMHIYLAPSELEDLPPVSTN